MGQQDALPACNGIRLAAVIADVEHSPHARNALVNTRGRVVERNREYHSTPPLTSSFPAAVNAEQSSRVFTDSPANAPVVLPRSPVVCSSGSCKENGGEKSKNAENLHVGVEVEWVLEKVGGVCGCEVDGMGVGR